MRCRSGPREGESHMSSTPPETHKKHQPSRRTVLKVSANAAWAVPAIQIAAATPAFAVSGDNATLTVIVAASIGGQGEKRTCSVTIKNTGNKDALTVSATVSGTVDAPSITGNN